MKIPKKMKRVYVKIFKGFKVKQQIESDSDLKKAYTWKSMGFFYCKNYSVRKLF